MNLQALEVFVDAAESCSFSEVAVRHQLSRSQVGRIVGQLEETLGVRLFHREGTQLTPTPAAEAYKDRVQSILEDLENANDCLKEGSGTLQGLVTVAASLTLCAEYLVPRLQALRQQHPLLIVNLVAQEENPLDFSRAKIDLGIQTGPRSEGGASQLLEVRHKLYAPPGWKGKLEHPGQLAELECLMSAPRWKFTNKFMEVTELKLRGPVQSRQELVLKQACLAGLGPAILPEWLAESAVKQKQLKDLLPDWTAQSIGFEIGIWAVWPGANLSPKGLALLEILKSSYLSQPKKSRISR